MNLAKVPAGVARPVPRGGVGRGTVKELVRKLLTVPVQIPCKVALIHLQGLGDGSYG